MAGYKNKKIKQQKSPEGIHVVQEFTPEAYYSSHPSWNFSSCDKECWSIYSKNVEDIFFTEILPHLQSWEKMNWKSILVGAKKQNHSIEISELNKTAISRMETLFVEEESLISLRLGGRHRIYGYMIGSVFNILWIDLNHGDNSDCVCRSRKRNT